MSPPHVQGLHFIPAVNYDEYRRCMWFRAKENPAMFLQ